MIRNVTVDDSATYVCKATNRIGSTKADRKLLVTSKYNGKRTH